MINVTLKQLNYFIALAETESFSAAAHRCSVSQPALSMQIKNLEDEFHQTLIEKGTRPLIITAFGELILERARAIVAQVEDMNDLMRAADKEAVGALRLGIIPTIAPYFLPQAIAALSQSMKTLQLRFEEAMTAVLIEALSEGRIDAAIVALPISEPDLAEIPLFEEEFVLVRPKSDAHLPVPDPEHLKTMRLLLLQEGHCFRDQALDVCNISDPTPLKLMEGSSLTTLVQMVSSGLGLTLIPQMAVGIEKRAANVDIQRFSKARPKRTVGLIYRTTSPLGSNLSSIAKVLVAAHDAADKA